MELKKDSRITKGLSEMNYINKDINSKIELAIASADYDYILQYLNGLIVELSELRDNLIKSRKQREKIFEKYYE